MDPARPSQESRSFAPRAAVEELDLRLRKVRALFRSTAGESRAHPKAADWFLDNTFTVQGALRQVRHGMPAGFYRRLPVSPASPMGLPRAYVLAAEILIDARLQPDPLAIESRAKAAQRDDPLTIAELWALPAFLRLRTLEILTEDLSTLLALPSHRRVHLEGEDQLEHIDEEERVAACIRTLRDLDEMRWRHIFQHCSEVEHVLAKDPARAYARMDFDTRDRYRKVIEEIAWRTGAGEVEVAEKALSLARRFAAAGGRRAHVGQYLVGEDTGDLEGAFGYVPPPPERLRRALRRHAALSLIGGIALATACLLLPPCLYLWRYDARPATLALGLGLALVPASTLGVTLVQWILTHLLPPDVLAKMDFSAGIPSTWPTFVVIPCLLGSEEEVRELVRQLELHYLRNPDPHLSFALLSDYLDADQEHASGDERLLAAARTGIERLNEQYGGKSGTPFHMFHRPRRWNASEGVWMGWERKRGKLEEFNALLLGEAATGFLHVGPEVPDRIRFVITLDAGTVLPQRVANRLVGTLAHPLNRPEYDPRIGRVTRGHAVLQPRVEISPTNSEASLFTRIFAGDTSIDIYSHAVSEVYQDLCGEGIYVGKGIYDVEAFHRCLEGRVPPDTLVSHDHVEGQYARAALVSDVLLLEDYPPQYLAYSRRLHRWVRGDWQFLPWLGKGVRDAQGRRSPNPVPPLGKWVLLDNLRRSLLAPLSVLFLVSGWLWLPGEPLVWTLAAAVAPGGHVLSGILSSLVHTPRRSRLRPWAAGISRALRESSARWGLYLVFLMHEAAVCTDAIARSLYRMFIRRRHLLEWRTAEHTARLLASKGPRVTAWKEMAVSPLLALVLGAAVAVHSPHSLAVAAPLLVAWIAAPEIAIAISRGRRRGPSPLDADEVAELRCVARRTWFFFESFVGPEDQWLPPDNYQEHPLGEIAHRTSPTNIGLLLSSTLAAYDLGFIGPVALALRLRNTLDTMDRMHRFRGHLFNWYDTRTLEPLEPRYVSTVDSGNLAAALVTVKQGCAEIAASAALLREGWSGLLDTLRLLEQAAERLETSDPQVELEPFREQVALLRARLVEASAQPECRYETLQEFCGPSCDCLDRELVASVTASRGVEAEAIHEVRLWLGRTHQQIAALQQDLEYFAPWLGVMHDGTLPGVLEQAGPSLESEVADLHQALRLPESMAAILDTCSRGSSKLEALVSRAERAGLGEHARSALAEWAGRLRAALELARTNTTSLQHDLLGLAAHSEEWVHRMDFRLLYDRERDLFRIGFDMSSGRPDPNHYDLLASEARIASFLAIAKGDAPVKHWFQLRRPVFRVNGRATLLSWGATMFEYAMPCIWTRSGQRGLLMTAVESAVDAQIAYAERHGAPWGISESGFYQLDAHHYYQYRSFGVPGLGLRRGLSEDLVITPYASALALPIRPHEVIENFKRLERLGMSGTYGFHEALDLTVERLPIGKKQAIVESYMAHHQGMILCAIDNALEQDPLVRRFQRDALAQTAELLLHEELPAGLPARIEIPEPETQDSASTNARVILHPWSPSSGEDSEEGVLLSNGRMTSFVTARGAGWLDWGDLALTRWREDPTRSMFGTWIFVRDEESGQVWSAAPAPTFTQSEERHVIFHAHLAEFQRRDEGIFLRMEVAVAPSDDVEIRHVTLTNETDRVRRISLTSYAEPVLTERRNDSRHLAFSKLFLESEYVDEEEALLFRRRPRSSAEHDAFLAHRLVLDGAEPHRREYETDRGAFLGRLRTVRSPRALLPRAALGASTGATLDSVMSVRSTLELQPFQTLRLAFITAAAGSRQAVLELLRRFRTLTSVDWAMQNAQAQAMTDAARLKVESRFLPSIHRLISRLQIPSATTRAEAFTIEANARGKPGLWGHGVSGDLPILLLLLKDPANARLLPDALKAHQYWRERGLRMDLVVLLLASSSYGGQDEGELRERLREHRSLEWMNRPGGIFVVHADQIPGDDRTLLEACARVILYGDRGELAAQLEFAEGPPPRLGPLIPQRDLGRPSAATAELEWDPELLFQNGYGGFSRDGSEYVIRVGPGQRTPAPWCNVLANPDFGCLVSESGVGMAWSVNSSLHRLTSWNNDPTCDPVSQVLYLRDEETGAVWSPTPNPAGLDSDCRVHHGTGYSDYYRNAYGLIQRMRVFVPREAPLEIITLRVSNAWKRPRRITATLFAELVLGDSREEALITLVPEYDEEADALLAHNPWNPEFAQRHTFMASSEPSHGITASREEFLGRDNDPAQPAALERWGLSGRVVAGVDPCHALMVHLELAPEEEREIWFLFGDAADRKTALELVETYRRKERVERAWDDLTGYWKGILGALNVRTPERSMDLLLNRWLPYQLLSSRIEGRTGFYQNSGGFGFRDQLQDVMALVHSAPGRVRAQILEAAAHQFEEGDVLHWWHPPGDAGVRTRCSDDLLWLPFVTAHYIRATGDLELLDSMVSFLRAPVLEDDEAERYSNFQSAPERSSLYEHCRRAIERGLRLGHRGLPLIGTGDWNDGMSRVGEHGQGESVWLAWFLVRTLRDFAAVVEGAEHADDAAEWLRAADELVAAAEAAGWDGAWYRRAWYDDGTPLGSKDSDECRIDLIAQAWSAFAGASPARVATALASAQRLLVDEDQRLIRLLAPSFSGRSHDPGYIAAYPPGIRENGGQYTHAACWLGWALAAGGDRDGALRIFQLMDPILRTSDPEDCERYRVEPYVLAGDVYGVEPHLGRGGWTWYTGAAAWMWRLGVECILGLKWIDGGLVLEPALPEHWDGFEAVVRTSAGECTIEVRRTPHKAGGPTIALDGEPLSAPRIPLEDLRGAHRVRVEVPDPDDETGRSPRAEERGEARPGQA